MPKTRTRTLSLDSQRPPRALGPAIGPTAGQNIRCEFPATRAAKEMFEITKDQLRRLGDADLRELIARLCEAELRMAGAPVSTVW